MKRSVMFAFVGLLAVAALTPVVGRAEAQMTKPLTIAGKTSLYQRVLSRPGALLRAAPNETAAGELLVPFTVYYVYARETFDGRDWLRIGSDSHGHVLGWLPVAEGIDWKQALTVAFKEPLTHNRVLMFRDRASVKELLDGYDVIDYRRLRRDAEAGIEDDSPVIAIQPQAHVDIHEDFYLVPILDHEDVFVGDVQGLLLRVATVPLREAPTPTEEEVSYRSGIVFVADTTTSMDPYIDQMRAVVRRIFKTIESAELTNQVGFGLVAFRDSTSAVPGLDYVTRTYARLADGLSPDSFFEKVESVEPAGVSSQGFDEDAFAGIKQAIEDVDWTGYDARYVILVTDAGPRTGSDPLSSTGLDAESLRRLALDKGVAIWVMHLLTPQGVQNHEYAAEHYRRLSHFPDVGDFYYPVEAGDIEIFDRALNALAAQLTDQVRDTARGLPPIPQPQRAPATELQAFQDKVAKLGYALRMRYLRKFDGAPVPTLFNAWMLDRDFEEPTQSTVEVRVLLTRDQLSDLQFVLKRVLETAELGALSPHDFLNDLKSLAASISRDPATAAGSTQAGSGGANLADLGYMREYIEDLPYRGEVMNLELATWAEWPVKRQVEFINRLESKINYYQALHDNLDLWISLHGGAIDGDSVYPLLLETLP